MPDNVGPSPASAEDLVSQAKFIFRGTVVHLNASMMPAVPPSARTAIVRVDEILLAPALLAGYTGQNITVQLSEDEQVSDGQEAIFYTNGWLFGDSIAVQSVGHHDVAVEVPALGTAGGDPVQNLANRNLRAHIADADAVVTGRVTATRLPDAVAAIQLPVSEHDPEWHDAEVAVASVEKGNPGQIGNTIVVRYPSSTDVRWYRVPKLRPGTTGIFILHEYQAVKAVEAPGAAVAPQAPSAFVLLHEEDFQPMDQLARVRALM